jgi:uncharacterized phage infection (PIP) family protein YhgE
MTDQFDGRRDQDVAGKIKEAGSDLKAKASEVAGQVTQAAKNQASELGTTAKKFASDAATSAQSAIEEQKSLGAEYVASVAGALHRAAGEFDRDVPFAAKYLHQTAEQIEHAVDTVRNHNARELVSDVENFARRQPALFFGGAMLLGFAALRFLKSAPENYGNTGVTPATSTPRVQAPSMAQFDEDVRRIPLRGS